MEIVTKCAEEYLNDHAVEMYALFRRRVKASKPGISYTKNQTPYYDEDRVCITIPCNILGYDVCEIIEMFDNHKITVDEEEDVVKIFQSVIFNTDIDYYGKQIEGIREHETKVIRPEYKLKKKGDTEEKEKMKDAEKSLKEFLKKFENKNEEITEKDAILV